MNDMKTVCKVLFFISLLFFSSCSEKEIIEINEIPGPYKDTVMEIKINLTDVDDSELRTDMLFSILDNNSIYWGDGVVEDAKGNLTHWYRNKTDYTITIKGLNKTPSFYIDDINIIEEVNWPMSE